MLRNVDQFTSTETAMHEMYLHFSDAARLAILVAQKRCLSFGRSLLSLVDEDVLCGIVSVTDGGAVKILEGLHILAQVEDDFSFLQYWDLHIQAGLSHPTLNSKFERVINYAIDEARLLGHPKVGTEHLLLGILRYEDCVAQIKLKKLGLTLIHARSEVEKLIPKALDPKITKYRVFGLAFSSENHHNVVACRKGEFLLFRIPFSQMKQLPLMSDVMMHVLEVRGEGASAEYSFHKGEIAELQAIDQGE